MPTRKFFTTSALPILMLLLLAAPAAAKRPDSFLVEQSKFLLRAPEARAQGWRNGLIHFLQKHQDLASEQAYAIQSLADMADPAVFAHTLTSSNRGLFANRLNELARTLPYHAYLGLLRSFDEELRVWLVRNGLASPIEAAVDTCTCSTSGGGCSEGYTCQDVTCVHEQGTTHNGRCGGRAEIE